MCYSSAGSHHFRCILNICLFSFNFTDHRTAVRQLFLLMCLGSLSAFPHFSQVIQHKYYSILSVTVRLFLKQFRICLLKVRSFSAFLCTCLKCSIVLACPFPCLKPSSFSPFLRSLYSYWIFVPYYIQSLVS